jgi:8-oxo-dGTP pyrophosphatase MutT (NUDIX family)
MNSSIDACGYPVSIKGVVINSGRVVLLKNERDEWELPGGRPESGEEHLECLTREIAEELGVAVTVGPLLDTWEYEVLPERHVVIVAYGIAPLSQATFTLSREHKALGQFELEAIDALPMPDGYKRSIHNWVQRLAGRKAQ